MAFVLTLLYIATSLLSPGVFPEGIVELHISVILGILVILTAVWGLPESRLVSLPDGYLAIGLLCATVISTLATGWFGGAVTTFMDFVPILFTFFFVAITCNTLQRIKILVYVMLLVAFFILSQAAIANYTGNVTSPYILSEVVGDGSVLYRWRGMGVIADPNDLAQVLVTLIPLLFLRWKKGSSSANFLFTIVPAAILTTGIFFTHSRGGTLALVAVVIFGFKDRLSAFGSAILGGVAMVAMLALGVGGGRGMDQDDGTRVAFWGTGLQVLKQHPIFGVGYGGFADLNGGRTAHNTFILAMVELGLVGYFFWMGMIVSSWSGLSRMIRSKAKIAKDKAKAALISGRSKRTNKVPSALSPLVGATVGAAPFSTRSTLHPDAQSISDSVGAWSSSSRPSAEDSLKTEAPGEDELAYAARIVRTAFVGMLAAGFFLSRTYALIIYVMLGVAVSLIRMSPKPVSLDTPTLAKRTVLIMVSSVIGMYIFVRLHGAM
jgi:O-antigen ligase